MSTPTDPPDFPERQARLKDGRAIQVRHGRPGDEAGIARLIVAAFPVYERAARGDRERAARSFAREVRPQEYVVAVLAESRRLIGVSRVDGRGQRNLTRLARLRRKLDGWGQYGLACFLVEKLRSRLFESTPFARPPGLYRYLDAVDAGLRSLGVGRHVADFVDDYARAAGHPSVSAKHRSDNQAVLELHRKRGCVLIACPPTLLARLLRQPHMVVSTRALTPDPGPRAAAETARVRSRAW